MTIPLSSADYPWTGRVRFPSIASWQPTPAVCVLRPALQNCNERETRVNFVIKFWLSVFRALGRLFVD